MEMDVHNQSLNQYYSNQIRVDLESNVRPFAEYERNGFVVFDSNFSFSSLPIKQAIAKNLPPDVTLIVINNLKSEKTIRESFLPHISKDRLKILNINLPEPSFWARDALPVPTVIKSSNDVQFVNAKYYHHLEPDQIIADYFKKSLISHGFYFEGGNLTANALGDCIIIGKPKKGVLPSDAVFNSAYGCSQTIRLPKLRGIGHVDESVKFISDKVLITDIAEYKATLTKKGFEVHMLPRSPFPKETYINSLIINGTVFVPVFGNPLDEAALNVYRSLGLKVVPINTKQLSNEGRGSIHCITMNYPPMALDALISHLSK